MFLKTYRVYLIGLLCLMFAGQPAKAQTDSLFLSVDQLFERGWHSLQLQADALKSHGARTDTDGTHIITARSASGIERRFCGTAGRLGTRLSGPTYPDIPDWSQNYAIDFSQPLYQGGKIRGTIHKAEMEKQVAEVADINRPGGNQTWFAEPIHESVQAFSSSMRY